MSIDSELSCDVAIAMLSDTGERRTDARDDLTEVVLEVHSTLRELTAESRRRRRAQILSAWTAQAASVAGSSSTSSGN